MALVELTVCFITGSSSLSVGFRLSEPSMKRRKKTLREVAVEAEFKPGLVRVRLEDLFKVTVYYGGRCRFAPAMPGQ
jgi:hypothetical protein